VINVQVRIYQKIQIAMKIKYLFIIFGFCLILIYAINLFAYEELIQKHNDEKKLLYKQLISQLIYLNKQDSIIAVKHKDIDYLKVRVEYSRELAPIIKNLP